MTQKMLIDASHPEETRVAILDGNRLEAFDFESARKKQLKGNIYLARVTRVEPSLQACFVEYGGNRQGFLAFSEIHPDYYQIPIADREALMAEEEEAEANEDAAEAASDDSTENAATNADTGEQSQAADSNQGETEGESETESESETETEGESNSVIAAPAPQNGEAKTPQNVETMGGDEADEARQYRRMRFLRKYKIQEVIKRKQILLVQVVKEERGEKGAALTSYISLPGRYCVLMPNSARSGVSRKINNYQDRRRMKTLISSLEVPDGMAVILRTAGADRPKTDIKRDCDYLLKLWDDIRDKTLQSNAPALIYEEGNLVKRAIRDLYHRDIEEVHIEGEEGYKTAKALMKVLTPSHAKRVQQFKDKAQGLFQKYQVESQIDAVHDNRVELPSGGYIIINQTEALVAIDVNSGRSTRERNIEETAYRTNLEAAEEVARQMRLRDLAGLIVIDFIDMEHHGNKVQIERRFKEFCKKDRARMQLGRISHFGLMELTRQRLRPSVLEGSSSKCPTCNGLGVVRSTESSALTILRAIEDDLGRNPSREIKVFMAIHAAMYLLNHKRAKLAELETEHTTRIVLEFDDSLVSPAHRIERLRVHNTDDGEQARPETPATDDNSAPREVRDYRGGGGRDRNRDRGRFDKRGGRGGGERGDRPNRGFEPRHNQRPQPGQEHAAATAGEENGNIMPPIDAPDDNIGNRADNRGERNGNPGRDDRRSGRGGRFRGRERGGRNRFGGRNRDNPGEGNGNGNTGPANEPHAGSAIATIAPESFAEAREFYQQPRSFEPVASGASPQPRAEPEPDPNVAVVNGPPSNPKRGWWRK